jgi:hypothetical protein
MIEDHVIACGYGDRVGSTISTHAHADPDVASDSVVGIRERKTITIDRNAISWSGLARNGDIG